VITFTLGYAGVTTIFALVSATDPTTVATVTALLVAVALAAIVMPVRRTVGRDPIAALRSN
jgi:hypothetical protein